MRYNDQIKEQSVEKLSEIRLKVAESESGINASNQWESNYRGIVSGLTEAIYVIQGGSIKFANEAFLELTGFSKAELLAGNVIEASIHRDDQKMAAQYRTRRLRGDDAFHRYELRLVCKDSSLKWVEIKSTLIIWEGKPADLNVLNDITDRKRDEENLRRYRDDMEKLVENRTAELRESREMLKVVIDNLPEAISYTDSNERYLFNNTTHQKWWNKPYENFIGLTVQEVMRDEYEIVRASRASALAGQEISTETTLNFGDGVTRDIWLRIVPCLGAGSEVKGVVEIIEDISDIKRAQRKVAESELKFRSVFEHTMDGILFTALDGAIFAANPAACQILGRSEKEICQLRGDKLENLTNPGLPGLLQKTKLDRRTECEVNLKHGSGRWIQIEVRSAIVRHLDDEERAVVCFREIEARKQSEETLRQSEKRYRELIEFLPVGVFELDLTGRFIFVNPALKLLHGYRQDDDFIQLTPIEMVAAEDRAKVAEDIQKLVDEQTMLSGEYLGFRKDGTTFPLLVNVTPILAKDEIVGFRGAVADVTTLKRTEREKQIVLTQFFQREKLEALSTLVGGLAHDFNNILQIILGYSQLLLDDREKGEPNYVELQTIILKVKEAAALIQKLLTFSQQGQTSPSRLDLNNRIRALTTLICQTVPKWVQIHLNLTEGPTMIRAGYHQIDQVIMNLVSNASEAMPKGGKLTIATKEVFLHEEYCTGHLGVKPGVYVMLSVTDTGSGMDEKALTRIFEPFFSTKQRGSARGIGLGLSVTQGIVQQHGGHISCNSKPGKGTEFKVYFPAIETSQEIVGAVTPTIPAREIVTILVVQNNPVIAEIVKKSLEWLGYPVILANNGSDALENYKTRKEEISLVIIDLVMPQISGRDCLMELLRVDPKVKVLISSNYAPETDLHKEISPFVKGFIYKPFGITELREAVGRVLGD